MFLQTMLLSQSLGSAETGLSSAAAEKGQFLLHHGGTIGTGGGDSGGTSRDEHFHNCGDFSQGTQASTDNEVKKNQAVYTKFDPVIIYFSRANTIIFYSPS